MPWDIKTENGKHCVYKKTTGKIMHCYDDMEEAKHYLAALWMHASEKELEPGVLLTKEPDGRWQIVTVSTAALPDYEEETFTGNAMNYEIKEAGRSGIYPEYRVFHSKQLGIGKVENMRRVGIFMIDQGHSYTDPFSLAVCEKMLANNDGTWRVSRGFYLFEASGVCSECDTPLLLHKEHLTLGFRCPKCFTEHKDYKGAMTHIRFLKTRTFDVTVTDNPSVPYTGVVAYKDDQNMLEVMMKTKEEMRKKLIDAGLTEDVVDARLKDVTEEQLKEYSALPFAQVLKEFKEDETETQDTGDEEAVYVLDDSVIDEIKETVTGATSAGVESAIKKAFESVEVAVPVEEIVAAIVKEINKEGTNAEIVALKEAVVALTEKVDHLLASDEERLKELLKESSPASRLRVMRFKAGNGKKAASDEEDEEDEEPVVKETIIAADGKQFDTMTQFVIGRK